MKRRKKSKIGYTLCHRRHQLPRKTDARYGYVRWRFEQKHFESFPELLEALPRTILAADLGIKTTGIADRMENPFAWNLDELWAVCKYLGVDDEAYFHLLLEQCRQYIRKKGLWLNVPELPLKQAVD